MSKDDTRAALDETVRVLAYLWDASGLVDGFTVRDLFAEDDPIRGDVPAAILRGRRALIDDPEAPSPGAEEVDRELAEQQAEDDRIDAWQDQQPEWGEQWQDRT